MKFKRTKKFVFSLEFRVAFDCASSNAIKVLKKSVASLGYMYRRNGRLYCHLVGFNRCLTPAPGGIK